MATSTCTYCHKYWDFWLKRHDIWQNTPLPCRIWCQKFSGQNNIAHLIDAWHEKVEERHELRPFLVEALSVFPCKTACCFLLLSGEKRQRRDRPQTGVLAPGTSALTKLSPERATEYITCLISICLYLCRPFGTFLVVAQLPGVLPFGQAQAEKTPVCGLSSLRDFRASPHELLFVKKAEL